MTKYLLIASGGAAGALLRYLVAGFGQRLTGGTFPLGTLLVNLIGCLAVGCLVCLFSGPAFVRDEYRIALLVGFLGAFTTFSTFGYETFALIVDHEYWPAAANVVLSNGMGLVSVWLGYRLGVLVQGS